MTEPDRLTVPDLDGVPEDDTAEPEDAGVSNPDRDDLP